MTLIVLIVSLVFLAVSGGGLFPATVGIVAVLLCGTACFSTLTRASKAAPCDGRRTTPLTQFFSSRPSRPLLEFTASAILLFVLLTAVPLPPVLDSLAGPLRHQQNEAVVSALHDAGQVGIPAPDTRPWFALSRNRAGTLRFFLLIAAAFGAAWLAASLSAKRKIACLHILALIGTAVAVAGYLGQWTYPQGHTLWWFIPLPHAVTTPVGCFLNRNHFGGFVALLCPIALALAHDAANRRRWLMMLVHFGLCGIMMTVVFHSLSRGALLALASGLSVTTLVIAFRHRAIWGLLLLCLILAGGAMILTRSAMVRDRLQGLQNPMELNSAQSRLAEWRESLRVFPQYPVLGAGMNALRMVYPQTRQTSVSARLIYAENEYIQLLAEGGLVGLGLTITLILAVRKRVREATERVPEIIIVSLAGALTVTAVHCLFDFPAHLPLYAVVLGTLIGLFLPGVRPLVILPAVIGLVGALVISLNQPGELKTLDDPAYLNTARYKDLQHALIWAPTSSYAWLYLGHAMIREGSSREDYALCLEGEKFSTRASELDPQNYRLWFELGKTREILKDYDRATEAYQHANQLRVWMGVPSLPGSKKP